MEETSLENTIRQKAEQFALDEFRNISNKEWDLFTQDLFEEEIEKQKQIMYNNLLEVALNGST